MVEKRVGDHSEESSSEDLLSTYVVDMLPAASSMLMYS